MQILLGTDPDADYLSKSGATISHNCIELYPAADPVHFGPTLTRQLSHPLGEAGVWDGLLQTEAPSLLFSASKQTLSLFLSPANDAIENDDDDRRAAGQD